MIMISIMEKDVKEQHSHAHALLRECLRRRGIAYDSSTPLVKGKQGKPSLAEHPEIHFNLSHAKGIAACIVSENECGIDCEKVRPFRENVMRRAFSGQERALVADSDEPDKMFFRLWTLKEAYVKALGIGISYPLAEAEFSFREGEIVTEIRGYSFRQYLIRGGEYIVSVCEKSS